VVALWRSLLENTKDCLKYSSPFLLSKNRKGFNNASIKQIKDGIIQSGIFYRQ
jgi:hypothetical protein